MGSSNGGWRFFGHYNSGESISQSWVSAALEECDCNHPVMAAYGATEEEAANTMLDGRFSILPAGNSLVVFLFLVP